VSFYAGRDGALLFDERHRKVLAVNAAAALCWLGLHEAEPLRVLEEELGIDAVTARVWWDDSVRQFASLGLLAASNGVMPAVSGIRPSVGPTLERLAALPMETAGTRRYHLRLLEQSFAVDCPDEVAPFLDNMLRPARVSESRGDVLHIDIRPADAAGRYEIVSGGNGFGQGLTAHAVGEVVENLLAEAVLHTGDHLLALHAALLQSEAGGIILAGASGAGKSTLTAALAGDGFGYGSDELIVLGRDFVARPVSLGPCIKKASHGLVERRFPDFAAAPDQLRYGQTVRFLGLDKGFCETRVSLVLFPHYQPGAMTAITPVAGWEGLSRLLDGCVFVPPGFGAADVAGLLRWHEELRYYMVQFGNALDAAEAVSRLTLSSRTQ
jgi:hypothetical protein